MAAKARAKLWLVDAPREIIKKKYVMLIGLDMFHNSRKKKESRIALCATVDTKFTEFYSKVMSTKK